MWFAAHKSKGVPLRVILIVPFVLLMLFMVGLTGYLAFRDGRLAVQDVAAQLRNEISSKIQRHLQSYLATPELINRINASVIEQGLLDVNNPVAMERYFWKQIQVFDSVTSIYFGNTRGGLADAGREGADGALYLITTDDFGSGPFRKYAADSQGRRGELLLTVPDFDARSRPWFARAAASGQVAWSDIYILFTGQDLAIAASRPVYDGDGGLLGVVSSDIFLSQLNGFLWELAVGKTGEAFIIERSGLLVASSSGEPLFSGAAQDRPRQRLAASVSANPVVREAVHQLTGQFGELAGLDQGRPYRFSLDGEHYFAQVTPLLEGSGPDWLILVVIPEADFMARINANARLTLMLILLLLGFTVASGILGARWLSRPLLRLGQAANDLIIGQPAGPVGRSRIREIDDLSGSFSTLTRWLEQSLADLNREIGDRRRAEERLQSIIEGTQAATWEWRVPSGELSVNERWAEIIGYRLETLPPVTFATWERYVHPDDLVRSNDLLQRHFSGELDYYECEVRMRHQAGHWVWVLDRGKLISRTEDGAPLLMVGIHVDISQIKESQADLDHLAHHDALTGLPNRLLWTERLDHAIRRAERHDVSLAVIFIDLDNFKHINDSLGHPMGDLLLQKVATALQGILRAEDTIARIGGDEFVLLFEEIAGAEAAIVMARKLMALFDRPFVLDGQEISATASLGICLYPGDGKDPDALLRNADAAMYRAKEAGRNNYHFYTEELTRRSIERVRMENALRQALKTDELHLVYQPQVDLRTGRVVGVEALIRWQHAEMGLVMPDRFIALAEESGLIHPIGEWVLRTACRQGRAWLDRGVEFGRIAINISGRQIQQGLLPQQVRRLLEETGLPAASLELEVTEGFIMRQAEAAIDQLAELRGLGVTLAIDDFGTGYSSLSYLKQLPIHKLKIDRSFVRDIPDDPNDMAITAAVIAMGISLGLTVIAEGVESDAQVDFLCQHDCHEGQGYLFSPPIRAEAMAAFLSARVVAADPDPATENDPS
jgi:diguanylate cyclase (GGDEF)-like protein/PAS domain S-box-containing protein